MTKGDQIGKYQTNGHQNFPLQNDFVFHDFNFIDIKEKLWSLPREDKISQLIDFLGGFFHQGRLYYNEEEKDKILSLIDKKLAIVVVNLERPANLTEINENCDALVADFGTSDEVLADIIFGEINPSGKLPFELPSSWEAVKKQFEDVPYDSENPLYKFGYGLSYDL